MVYFTCVFLCYFSFERPKSPTLTLSMIHVDSEAVSSEHVFRLESEYTVEQIRRVFDDNSRIIFVSSPYVVGIH